MRRQHWWTLGLVAGAGMLAGLAGIAFGVELHRRWPFEGIERSLERYAVSIRPLDPWRFRARMPTARYEPLTAAVDGRLLVINGFHNSAVEATTRVEAYDPEADSWTVMGDAPGPTTHSIGAVVGGVLWIAGGFVGDDPGRATDEVWQYDVRTDRWSRGAKLPAPRGGGGLVALADGTLHFMGGWLPDRRSDAADHWRLLPGDSVWTAVAPLPVARGHASAAVLDGFIYFIGGARGHDPVTVDIADVHRYDPGTDQWTSVAPLPLARSHAEPGTFVAGGRIYVVGGRALLRGHPRVDDVVMYDPAYDTWSFVALLPRGLLAPAARALGDELFVTGGGERGLPGVNQQSWSMPLGVAWRPGRSAPAALGEVAGGVIGNRLYLVGEGDRATLSVDLGSGHWMPALQHAQRPVWGHHHAAEVLNGKLHLIGGLLPRASSDAVQIYDPATDSWHFGPTLPYRVGSSASAVIGNRIYLAGGIVDDTSTRQALVLDESGVWRSIAPMPRARNHAASATDGRRLYVFGGRGPGSGDANVVANGYDDVQIYDPVTDTWVASGTDSTSPARLPQARGGMGKAVYADGEFYVIGGETLDGPGATANGVYDRVDVYDPVRNTWRAGPPLRTARHGIFPVAHGPAIWVAGGGVKSGASFSRVVEVLIRAGPD